MFLTVPKGETWLSTRQAARVLGISEWSLRRYANAESGFLLEGKHFKKGPYRTSKTAWHREEVKEAMEQRKQLREIREMLQSIEDGSKQAVDI